MPAENQARGQCDNHKRDVVSLAGAIRTPIKDDCYCKHQEACTQGRARLDNTHGTPKLRLNGCTAICRKSVQKVEVSQARPART